MGETVSLEEYRALQRGYGLLERQQDPLHLEIKRLRRAVKLARRVFAFLPGVFDLKQTSNYQLRQVQHAEEAARKAVERKGARLDKAGMPL